MRKLLYVPVIHSESDMGSVSSAVDSRSASLCGEERWANHKETVAKFWDRLADYFHSLDCTNLKVYQDGLVASGELGRKIVAEGANRGSKNYEIIHQLMERGAEVRTTEDASLLRQEYEYISRLTQAESPAQRTHAYREYEAHKNRLSNERDRFVARTINETLGEREVGILFMGAYHDVLSHLANDIVVEQVKEQEKVRAYFKKLPYRRDARKFEQLAQYIASPIIQAGSDATD